MKAIGQGSMSSFLAGLLNVVWYVALIPGTLLLVILAGSSFAKDGPRLSLPVSYVLEIPPHPVTAPSLGIEKARIEGWSGGIGFTLGQDSTATNLRIRGALNFAPHPGAFLALHVLIVIVLGALGGFAILQLRNVLRTMRDGQPFVPGNATRLRWIALAVIAFELTRFAVALFDNYYAKTYFVSEGLQFRVWPDLNVGAIVNGLIILVIAEVFRVGTRLDEEQSLTV
jgi:hypothetical protein